MSSSPFPLTSTPNAFPQSRSAERSHRTMESSRIPCGWWVGLWSREPYNEQSLNFAMTHNKTHRPTPFEDLHFVASPLLLFHLRSPSVSSLSYSEQDQQRYGMKEWNSIVLWRPVTTYNVPWVFSNSLIRTCETDSFALIISILWYKAIWMETCVEPLNKSESSLAHSTPTECETTLAFRWQFTFSVEGLTMNVARPLNCPLTIVANFYSPSSSVTLLNVVLLLRVDDEKVLLQVSSSFCVTSGGERCGTRRLRRRQQS